MHLTRAIRRNMTYGREEGKQVWGKTFWSYAKSSLDQKQRKSLCIGDDPQTAAVSDILPKQGQVHKVGTQLKVGSNSPNPAGGKLGFLSARVILISLGLNV